MIFSSFIPLISVLCIGVGVIWGAHWALLKRNPTMDSERKFPRQVLIFGLMVLTLLALILALPIAESSQHQLLSLIGIVMSALMAFSSATIASNLMAGLLMRITKPFQVGDFIEIEEHFGRVSEFGLFHTEIQTNESQLVTFPNTYCINRPMAMIRRSGTVVSASLSLGYELDHKKIEALLIEAGKACDLEEPFVHIMELGDFSVTYRVSGLLNDTKRLFSAQSNLYTAILDTLHNNEIEIVSPTFVNQRRVDDMAKMIPQVKNTQPSTDNQTEVAKKVFDKAEKAEELEQEKQQTVEHIEQLKAELKDAPAEEKNRKKMALEQRKDELSDLESTDLDNH